MTAEQKPSIPSAVNAVLSQTEREAFARYRAWQDNPSTTSSTQERDQLFLTCQPVLNDELLTQMYEAMDNGERVPPALREKLQYLSQSLFLAGILEAGGTANIQLFTQQRKRKDGIVSRLKSSPRLTFAANEATATYLKMVYGGTKALVARDTWEWRITGRFAAKLGERLTPYSYRRLNMYEAFSCWDKLATEEEKNFFAKKVNSTVGDNTSDTNKDLLKKLVQKPDYVRGILMARGYHIAGSQSFRIQCQNPSLLLALQEEYGGIFLKSSSKHQVLCFDKQEKNTLEKLVEKSSIRI